jgi:hypothetical protein
VGCRMGVQRRDRPLDADRGPVRTRSALTVTPAAGPVGRGL